MIIIVDHLPTSGAILEMKQEGDKKGREVSTVLFLCMHCAF